VFMSYEALIGGIIMVALVMPMFYLVVKSTRKEIKEREQEGKSLVEKSDLKVLGYGLLAIFIFGIISLLLIL